MRGKTQAMLLKNLPKYPRRCYTTTVDSEEIKQFSKFNQTWWDKSGPTKPLHSMNRLRIPFIRDGLFNSGTINPPNCVQPLKGLKFLDVGCGGGILSQPLARLGGSVTGIDANPDIIPMAENHAKQQNLKIDFQFSSIEDHCAINKEKYDVVVASEILEHVTRKDDFLKACVDCLKPNGSIFITTINKTAIANILGVIVAENIGLIPKGTHEITKFVEPHKLQKMLEDRNCRIELVHGMCYNFLTDNWSWSSDTSINYSLHAIKNVV